MFAAAHDFRYATIIARHAFFHYFDKRRLRDTLADACYLPA